MRGAGGNKDKDSMIMSVTAIKALNMIATFWAVVITGWGCGGFQPTYKGTGVT